MKHTGKSIAAVLMGLAVAGALFAQDGRRDRGPPSPPNPRFNTPPASVAAETVTVSGTLQLVNGRIAVVDTGKTYYAGQLIRLAGFIEGLREGAQVTLKGNAERYPSSTDTDSYRLRITTLTLNGKVYDNMDWQGGPERAAPPRWGPNKR